MGLGVTRTPCRINETVPEIAEFSVPVSAKWASKVTPGNNELSALISEIASWKAMAFFTSLSLLKRQRRPNGIVFADARSVPHVNTRRIVNAAIDEVCIAA